MRCARARNSTPGISRMLMVDDEHGHRDVLIGQIAQHRQSRGGRRGTDNPEILAEPPAEIVPQCPHDPRVIIDHEQDRM